MSNKLANLNTAPTYELNLPFSKKKVKYRPYTVAEQKLLLLAKEENSNSSMVNAIRQMVKNCTFNQIDIKTIPTFETELLLLNIRGRAVSETIDLVMTCTACDKQSDVKIKIDEIKVVGEINDNPSIKLSDELFVVMGYPTAISSAIATGIDSESSETQQFNDSLDLMISCIKQVVHGDDVYEMADQSKEDVMAFLDTLLESQINALKEFIESCPTVLYQGKHICKHCQEENETFIGGLANFFG